MTDAGLGVVVPAWRDAAPVGRVLAELPPHLLACTVVVDDGSPEPIPVLPGVVWERHPENRGYGAAQKTGYRRLLELGVRAVVLLHGDAQYPVGPTLALAAALDEADVVLGSRFLDDGGRHVPAWRRLGNRALTALANARYGTRLSELHTGARAFRAEVLAALPLQRFSDDYLFDQQVLCAALARGLRVAERPVTAVYDGTVQSIDLRRSVVYGLGCVREIARTPPLLPPTARHGGQASQGGQG